MILIDQNKYDIDNYISSDILKKIKKGFPEVYGYMTNRYRKERDILNRIGDSCHHPAIGCDLGRYGTYRFILDSVAIIDKRNKN